MKNEDECLEIMSYRNNNKKNHNNSANDQTNSNDVVMSPPDTTMMVVVSFLVVIGLMAILKEAGFDKVGLKTEPKLNNGKK